MGKHALKSMLPHSFRALLVRVCGETSLVGDVIPPGGTRLWIPPKLGFVWFDRYIISV